MAKSNPVADDREQGLWNLAQTLAWITNHIGRFADRASIDDAIVRLDTNPTTGAPSLLRTLVFLQNLKGSEGIVEVPFRDGYHEISIARVVGASISPWFENAMKLILDAIRAGRITARGHNLDDVAPRLTVLEPDAWAFESAVFLEDSGRTRGLASPLLLVDKHPRVGWDLLRFNAAEISKTWPFVNLELPHLTDDDAKLILRAAMDANGGFIGQKKGAAIVREVDPTFNQKHAMALTKSLTRNTTPGPKGPREKSCG